MYPPSLEALVNDKYLRAIPVDPFTTRGHMADDDVRARPGESVGAAGIYDVKSGSERTALDGSPYSNW